MCWIEKVKFFGEGIVKNVEIGVVLGKRRKVVKKVTESEFDIVVGVDFLKEIFFCKMRALIRAISNFNFFKREDVKSVGVGVWSLGGM